MADDFPDFVKFEGFAGQAWYHQHMREKRILRRAREFTPERLLEKGEQGVWYDPSDTTTLFQDSAGTTPVTASGQPVGLMLDKSKGLVRGPELAVNGGFDNGLSGWSPHGAWSWDSSGKAKLTGTGNPEGIFQGNVFVVGKTYEITFDLVFISGSGGFGFENLAAAVVTPFTSSGPCKAIWTADKTELAFKRSSGTITVTLDNVSIKELTGNHARQATAASRPIYRRGDSRGVVNQLLNTETLATQSRTVTAVGHTLSFTGTGSITLSGASTAGPLVGTGVNDRVSLTFTPTAGSLTLTVSGSVTKGQLNLGPTALPYQRNDANLGGVATGASTDLHWLETDGVDDGMATGNINFTGTDKVSVFAGVRKLRDATTGSVAELGADVGTVNGSFQIRAPATAAANYAFNSRGTLTGYAVSRSTYPAPNSSVLTGAGSISGDVTSVRVNGVVTTAATDQGTGNFGNYPLYLFRRGGTSLPFNGWFYGLAITGRLATNAETVATERFLAAKSAVVIP